MFDEDFVIFLGVVGIVMLVLFGLVVWGIHYDCSKFQEATGRQTKVVGLATV